MFHHCAETNYGKEYEYLGRLMGLSAKKNRLSKVATTARQNSNKRSIQNWSLMDSMAFSDPSVSVSTKTVGITKPTAVPTILMTDKKANASDLLNLC